MPCVKYVQKYFWWEHFCPLQVFLCALVSRPVRVRTRTQLRGNIALCSKIVSVLLIVLHGLNDL